ncbi:MAG: hypothetical protein H7A55_07890 [Verrucomicrobiaceae bacterium]|nr:hypothetical protein [Verrucomicrobiaceae bacterium]
MNSSKYNVAILIALNSFALGHGAIGHQRESTETLTIQAYDVALLPPVAPTLRAEINQLRGLMRKNAGDPFREPSQVYVDLASRLVEYGELVGQTLLWDYINEPPSVKGHAADPNLQLIVEGFRSDNGEEKLNLMTTLHDDPTLVRWMLPMMRHRLAFFNEAISKGRTSEFVSMGEIGVMELIFFSHGEMADIEEFRAMIGRAARAGFQEQLYGDYPSGKKLMEAATYTRTLCGLHPCPYYVKVARSVVAQGGRATPALERALKWRREEMPTSDSLRGPETRLALILVAILIFAALVLGIFWYRKQRSH